MSWRQFMPVPLSSSDRQGRRAFLTRAKLYRERADGYRGQSKVCGIEPHVREHYLHLAEMYVGVAEAVEKLAAPPQARPTSDRARDRGLNRRRGADRKAQPSARR